MTLSIFATFATEQTTYLLIQSEQAPGRCPVQKGQREASLKQIVRAQTEWKKKI